MVTKWHLANRCRKKVTNCVLQTVPPVIPRRLSLRVTIKSQALCFNQFLIRHCLPPIAPGTIWWRELFPTAWENAQMHPITLEGGSVEAGQLWDQLRVEIEALGALVVQWAAGGTSKTTVELYTGFWCLWMQLIDSFLLVMYNMYIYH